MKNRIWLVVLGLCLCCFVLQGCSAPGAKKTESAKPAPAKSEAAKEAPAEPVAASQPAPEKQAAAAAEKPPAVTSAKKAADSPPPPPALGDDISPDELRRLMASGEKMVVLDVREPAELTAWPEKLDGAVNIPLGQLSNRAAELPREGKIVVVCRSGRRSAQAAGFLRSAGFASVHNLAGGMNLFRQTEKK